MARSQCVWPGWPCNTHRAPGLPSMCHLHPCQWQQAGLHGHRREVRIQNGRMECQAVLQGGLWCAGDATESLAVERESLQL